MKGKDWAAAALVAGLYAALYFLGAGCPIRALTGVSCAGCGMTRAWLAVLQGDLTAAFAYHPLFWLVPVAAALFLARRRLPRPVARAALWGICGAFLLVYAVRMLDPEDAVVTFAPHTGLLYRLVRTWLP